jgi:4-amino-4-deoxy-L-arabinose transferase-like glycosyltransferase
MPAGAWLLLGAASAWLFGCGFLRPVALTNHEALLAGIARQMIETGNWAYQAVGDRPWLDKPALPHWLTALSLLAFGEQSERAARLPAALAGIGVVLLIADLAARWFGPRIGLLSGLLLATSWYLLRYATLAEADIQLCLATTAAIWVLVRLQAAPAAESGRQRRLAFAYWLLLGIGNLIKGPAFGLVFSLLPGLAWQAWRGDRAALRRLVSPAGILVALAITAIWPATVTIGGQGAALLAALQQEVTSRIGPEADSEFIQPAWYYLTTIPWQLLPWTPILLVGAGPSLRRAWRERDAPDRLIWCWLLVPVLLLSVPQGKHHQYLINALPALAPVTALGWVETERRLMRLAGRRAALLLLAIPLAIVAGTAVAASRRPGLCWDIVAIGAVAALGTALAVALLAGLRPALTGAAVLLTTIGIVSAATLTVVPALDPSVEDDLFLRRVGAAVPRGAPLIGAGFYMDVARFVFYVEPPLLGLQDADDLPRKAPRAGTFYVIAKEEYRRLLNGLGRVAVIDESARPRQAFSPEGRFTLYRVDR